MKAMINRWICVILMIAVFLSAAIPGIAAETDEIIRVFCISNLCNAPDPAVDLLLINDEAYIRAKDAALYSGFRLDSSKERPEFSRGDMQVTFTIYANDGIDSWIPLFKGMQMLDTQVDVESGVLWFTARKHTFEDLLEVTEVLVSEPYSLEKLFGGQVGERGKFGAWLINLISNDPIEEIMASIGGDLVAGDATQSKEDYQEVIMLLLSGSQDDPYLQGVEIDYETGKDILKAAKKIVKAFEKTDKLFRKLANNKEFMELLEEWSYQDLPGSSLAALLGSKSMKYYMEVSAANSKKSIADKISEHTGELVKVNGYGLADQLDIAQYMYSLYTAATAYRDMFLKTYYGEEGNINYAPEFAKSIIKDIEKTASNEKNDDIWTLVKEEASNVLKGSTAATVKNLFKKGLFKSSPDGLIYTIAKEAVVFCFEAASGFKMKGSAKYIERGVALTEIQSGIKQMYDDYKADEGNALVVKYAALMYARCYQLAYEMLCDVDKTKPIIINEQELILLSQISDRDLTAVVENKACSADDLRLCAELYQEAKDNIEVADEDRKMELTTFLGMRPQQLLEAIPECVLNKEDKSFSTPKALIKGKYDENITFIQLILSKSDALKYQICGIYPGMSVEHALNVLDSQGFRMELIEGKWIGSSGNIQLQFFTTLGNNVSHIGADVVEPEMSPDLSKYMGSWENADEELTIDIYDYGDDYIAFELTAYRLCCLDNLEASMDSNGEFAFPSEYDENTEIAGSMHIGDDTVTLSVSYVDVDYLDFLIGRDIVFTRYAPEEEYGATIEAAGYFPLSPREIIRELELTDIDDGYFLDEYGGLLIYAENDEIREMILSESGKYSLFGVQPGMSEDEAILALEEFDGEFEIEDIYWEYGIGKACVYYDGAWLADIHVFAESGAVEEIDVLISEGDQREAQSSVMEASDTELANYLLLPLNEFEQNLSVNAYYDEYGEGIHVYEGDGFTAIGSEDVNRITNLDFYGASEFTLFGARVDENVQTAFSSMESFYNSLNNKNKLSVEELYWEDGYGEATIYSSDGWLGDMWINGSHSSIYDFSLCIGYSQDDSDDYGESLWMYPYSGTGWVENCENWVSLREWNSTDAPRLAEVPLDAEIIVMGETDSFYYCEYNGIEGYILKEYVLFGMS